MSDQESLQLLARFRDGDTNAATQLFDRYVGRLIGLARTRLSGKLSRRVDPEDIVQSAYRSFFRSAEEGKFELHQSGDLWSLLVAITLNKLRMQARRHQAEKRSLKAEESIMVGAGSVMMAPERLAEEPQAHEVAALTEQLELVMSDLDQRQRQILELRLAGHFIEEIADKVECSE
jgi:RNA polymerase sigma-70 factor (ECF subfamily)